MSDFRVFHLLKECPMSIKQIKALVLVLILLLTVGVISVGCTSGKKPENAAWVNTESLPGNTFKPKYQADASRSSKIIYLGSEYDHPDNSGFGPKDVSFELRDLKN